MNSIFVVGTADTKGDELDYIAACVSAAGGNPLKVDVGTRQPLVSVDISAREVAAAHPEGAGAVLAGDDRGAAVAAMGEAFSRFIANRTDIAGIIGIGGGGGTSIVSRGMRALPIGVPKLLVSTLASGDVGPYVGASDIVMMPAITDLAGLNRISRVILGQAGRAIVAMSEAPREVAGGKTAIGLTMFGVTTAGVTQVQDLLNEGFECVVFHATGTGGRTMEALVSNGMLSGVIDMTTTEIADLLCGGVLAAAPERLDCIAARKIPYVGSFGACDMVNFWARDTVPAKYSGRTFYQHNDNVTLMRTNAEECAAIGTFIAQKLNRCDGPVRFLIPEQGVSALDKHGGAFFDKDADAALFEAFENEFQPGANRKALRVPYHINDPEYAGLAAETFREIMI